MMEHAACHAKARRRCSKCCACHSKRGGNHPLARAAGPLHMSGRRVKLSEVQFCSRAVRPRRSLPPRNAMAPPGPAGHPASVYVQDLTVNSDSVTHFRYPVSPRLVPDGFAFIRELGATSRIRDLTQHVPTEIIISVVLRPRASVEASSLDSGSVSVSDLGPVRLQHLTLFLFLVSILRESPFR